MKNSINVAVRRSGKEQRLETFTVMVNVGESTILEVLQQIQEEQDDSLAIRYGCRYKQCGLCAVRVNGHSRMACMTKVKAGMVIEPIEKIPVQQDLVVERSFITEEIRTRELFPKALNPSIPPITTKEFDFLSKCTDCQSCLAGCPEYSYENMDRFSGPLFFVKLAQLQSHPQNEYDYSEKAKEMGILHCEDCKGCPCPYGIPIKKLAIDPFLDKNKQEVKR